jgi:hypothetical protein
MHRLATASGVGFTTVRHVKPLTRRMAMGSPSQKSPTQKPLGQTDLQYTEATPAERFEICHDIVMQAQPQFQFCGAFETLAEIEKRLKNVEYRLEYGSTGGYPRGSIGISYDIIKGDHCDTGSKYLEIARYTEAGEQVDRRSPPIGTFSIVGSYKSEVLLVSRYGNFLMLELFFVHDDEYSTLEVHYVATKFTVRPIGAETVGRLLGSTDLQHFKAMMRKLDDAAEVAKEDRYKRIEELVVSQTILRCSLDCLK